MSENRYLRWLSQETRTRWWNDSADSSELEEAMGNGAAGDPSNPVLVRQALLSRPDRWNPGLLDLPPVGPQRAEEIARRITVTLADTLRGCFQKTGGAEGFACAQVDPSKAADRDAMLAMAKRLAAWAPNIAVKLPVTAAGLEVLEECAGEGLTVTATVSFTVPQVLAVAERFERALERARRSGRKPGQCFAVIMAGRLDDYLRDLARDAKAPVEESDITQAGLAVVKRAYSLFVERGYRAILMTAAMRGAYHVAGLSGARMVLSIVPRIAKIMAEQPQPWKERIQDPIAPEVIARLRSLPEFVRAYEPDGMKAEEFLGFGLTQRTLMQFAEAGWLPLEKYEPRA